MRMLLWALAALFLANAAVAQDGYRIQPGDVLAVEVLQDPSLNRELIVLPDGSISFPFIGTLQAGGRSIDDVAASISQGIASNFAVTPNVFLTVREARVQRPAPATGGVPAAPRTISVYFLGEVSSPGAREMAPGTTLLQGLAQSGGFTNFAALRRLQLRRTDPVTGQETVVEFDYRAIQRGAVVSGNVVLADGDVILAPERRLFE